MIHLSSHLNCAAWIFHAMHHFYHNLTKRVFKPSNFCHTANKRQDQNSNSGSEKEEGIGAWILSFCDQEHTPTHESEAGEKDRKNGGGRGGKASWPMSV